MKPYFEGETVVLRPFEPSDMPSLHSYLNSLEIEGRRYIPWEYPWGTPLSRGQVEAIVQKWAGADKSLCLAVARLERDDLIGHAECDWEWDPHCPSISAVIAPHWQRQGYGSEVFRLLLRHLFENTVAHSVGCWLADWNEPALRFVQQRGFVIGGRMRRAGVRNGAYYDMIIADLLRPEWRERRSGHAT